MKELCDNTVRIENQVLQTGLKLVKIWEHDFDNNKDMKSTKLTEFYLIEPPKLRDAFYRGRTEPIKLLKNFQKYTEKGKNILMFVHFIQL